MSLTRNYLVAAVSLVPVFLFSTDNVFGQSVEFYYGSYLIVNASDNGSNICVDLDDDEVQVEIDGERYDIPVLYTSFRVYIYGAEGNDEIEITGEDEDDRDYSASVDVSCGGGDDIVENRTDAPMTASGGDGSDILMGGEGDDLLAADHFPGPRVGRSSYYDTNASDMLYGGGGADQFYNRIYFYKSYYVYYLVYDGKKYSISKSQYDYYSSLLESSSGQRGSTYDFELFARKTYKYVSSEIADIVDLDGDDLQTTLIVYDNKYQSQYSY